MAKREPWDEDEENDPLFHDPIFKVLQPIYDRLTGEGVPRERWPSLESLVSHLLEWADPRKMERWFLRFVRVEKPSDEDHKHDEDEKKAS